MQILDLEFGLVSSSQEHLLAEGFQCWQTGQKFGFAKRENCSEYLIQVRSGKVSGERDCLPLAEKGNDGVGCYEKDTDFKGHGLPDNKVCIKT